MGKFFLLVWLLGFYLFAFFVGLINCYLSLQIYFYTAKARVFAALIFWNADFFAMLRAAKLNCEKVF